MYLFIYTIKKIDNKKLKRIHSNISYTKAVYITIHYLTKMGVNSLGKLLKGVLGKNSNAIVEKNLNSYNGQVVAIDASLQLYRFVLAIRNSNGGDDMQTINGKLTSHIFGIKCKAIQLLRNGILPIFVFDGIPPSIKRKTLQDRKKVKIKAQNKLQDGQYDSENEKIKLVKRTFFITEQHIKELQHMLDLMGLPYIQAVGEAESQCAALDMIPHVDVNGVVTEDWDALLFGCKKMLRNFSNKGKVSEVNLDAILEELELTHEQFIELCIILGTDYCSSIKGIGPVQAYNTYKKFGNINGFLKHIRDMKGRGTENMFSRCIIPKEFEEPVLFEGTLWKRWEVVKEYYLNAYVKDPFKIDLNWKQPNIVGFRHFMLVENEFNDSMISRDINILTQLYSGYIDLGYPCYINDHQYNYNCRYEQHNQRRYNKSNNRITVMSSG